MARNYSTTFSINDLNDQLYSKEIIMSPYCIHKLFCHNIVIQIKFKIVKRIRCLYLKKEIQMCM